MWLARLTPFKGLSRSIMRLTSRSHYPPMWQSQSVTSQTLVERLSLTLLRLQPILQTAMILISFRPISKSISNASTLARDASQLHRPFVWVATHSYHRTCFMNRNAWPHAQTLFLTTTRDMFAQIANLLAWPALEAKIRVYLVLKALS